MTNSDAVNSIHSQADSTHEVVRELYARFGEHALTFQTTVDNLPTLWVERSLLTDVLRFLRGLPRPYVMLYDLSAIDERLRTHRDGQPKSDFTVFYHLLSLERNSDVRIKVALSEGDLNIPSVMNIWPNADWYEREVFDLFGIHFSGHPRLYRILLPRYWKGHPLRKEYPARATAFDPF